MYVPHCRKRRDATILLQDIVQQEGGLKVCIEGVQGKKERGRKAPIERGKKEEGGWGEGEKDQQQRTN